MRNFFKEVTLVLSVGSVDGVCTSAAVLRNSYPETKLQFCQPFTVDRVDPTKWGENEKVLFLDLGVNNRDKTMTHDFLRRIKNAGHEIIGVLDEHNADDWKEAFESAELSFDDLVIKPVSQDKGDIKSSGALLLSLFGEELDNHSRELCQAGDAGDRMDFTTHFGGLVNQAVKSKLNDDSRRVHLAKHFALHKDPDEKIIGWISEYEEILQNHQIILEEKKELGDGLVRLNTKKRAVDMTQLMKTAYQLEYSVVIVEYEGFFRDTNEKKLQVSFGVNPKIKFDILATIKEAGIKCSGFESKANLNAEDEEKATQAVRKSLRDRI